MNKNEVTPYQYKLDLGEGEDCHKAYEEYLTWSRYEDSNERWTHFVGAWEAFERLRALMERKGQTLQ
jgi:hypothetical protein